MVHVHGIALFLTMVGPHTPQGGTPLDPTHPLSRPAVTQLTVPNAFGPGVRLLGHDGVACTDRAYHGTWGFTCLMHQHGQGDSLPRPVGLADDTSVQPPTVDMEYGLALAFPCSPA